MATILILTSDDERHATLREAFRGHAEWELVEAASGKQGREAFQQFTVDLVVIDVATAGTNGHEFYEWIRNDYSSVPVILLTADDSDEQSRVQALVMGAASYVPQSLVARDLVVTVERILGLTGCHRRHARLMESLVATETSFRIENNDLAMIPVLIGHLIDTAEEFGVITARNRVQVAVALEEALTNAIVHGNLGVPSDLKNEDFQEFYRFVEKRREDPACQNLRLFVRGEFEPGFSRFTIADEGNGFDPAKVGDPTEAKNLDKPHGRGLFLMRAFMDEVAFNETGNEIRLTKRGAAS